MRDGEQRSGVGLCCIDLLVSCVHVWWWQRAPKGTDRQAQRLRLTVRYCVVGSRLRHQPIIDYEYTWTRQFVGCVAESVMEATAIWRSPTTRACLPRRATAIWTTVACPSPAAYVRVHSVCLRFRSRPLDGDATTGRSCFRRHPGLDCRP